MQIQKNERNITTKSNVKLGWIVLPKKKKSYKWYSVDSLKIFNMEWILDDSEEILDMIDALWFCRKVSFLELQGDMFRGKI